MYCCANIISDGYSQSGAVSDNTAKNDGGTFNNTSPVAGGQSDSGAVSENTVTTNMGNFNLVGIMGGYSLSGQVTENTVNIAKCTFGSGSTVHWGESNIGAVIENAEIISGDIFKGGLAKTTKMLESAYFSWVNIFY